MAVVEDSTQPEDGRRSAKDIARAVIDGAPETASINELLLAIHSQSDLIFALKSQEMMRKWNQPQSRSMWEKVSDAFGCLIPVLIIPLIFILMPVLFSVGDFLVSRPVRTIQAGSIIDFINQAGEPLVEFRGLQCRLYSNHAIIVRDNGSVTIIPNEQYQSITLNPQ